MGFDSVHLNNAQVSCISPSRQTTSLFDELCLDTSVAVFLHRPTKCSVNPPGCPESPVRDPNGRRITKITRTGFKRVSSLNSIFTATDKMFQQWELIVGEEPYNKYNSTELAQSPISFEQRILIETSITSQTSNSQTTEGQNPAS